MNHTDPKTIEQTWDLAEVLAKEIYDHPDAGCYSGMPSKEELEHRIAMKLQSLPELTCRQCGCTHASAYDLGRADERKEQGYVKDGLIVRIPHDPDLPVVTEIGSTLCADPTANSIDLMEKMRRALEERLKRRHAAIPKVDSVVLSKEVS